MIYEWDAYKAYNNLKKGRKADMIEGRNSLSSAAQITFSGRMMHDKYHISEVLEVYDNIGIFRVFSGGKR